MLKKLHNKQKNRNHSDKHTKSMQQTNALLLAIYER
jgi:hypothetical protein